VDDYLNSLKRVTKAGREGLKKELQKLKSKSVRYLEVQIDEFSNEYEEDDEDDENSEDEPVDSDNYSDCSIE